MTLIWRRDCSSSCKHLVIIPGDNFVNRAEHGHQHFGLRFDAKFGLGMGSGQLRPSSRPAFGTDSSETSRICPVGCCNCCRQLQALGQIKKHARQLVAWACWCATSRICSNVRYSRGYCLESSDASACARRASKTKSSFRCKIRP